LARLAIVGAIFAAVNIVEKLYNSSKRKRE